MSPKILQRVDLTLCLSRPLLKGGDRGLGRYADIVPGKIYASCRAPKFSRIVKRLCEVTKIGLFGF